MTHLEKFICYIARHHLTARQIEDAVELLADQTGMIVASEVEYPELQPFAASVVAKICRYGGYVGQSIDAQMADANLVNQAASLRETIRSRDQEIARLHTMLENYRHIHANLHQIQRSAEDTIERVRELESLTPGDTK